MDTKDTLYTVLQSEPRGYLPGGPSMRGGLFTESGVVRKPSAEIDIFRLVDTECVFHEARHVCTAPPDYKCPYRKVRVLAQ